MEKELGRTRGTLEYILSGEKSSIRAESTTGHEDTREEGTREEEEEEEERERERENTM